jgi:hypothetical protein
MSTRMKIACRAQLFALLWMVTGCAATVVPDDDAAGGEVSATEQDLRARSCRRDADCPRISCTECGDGSSVCPEADCVLRRCVYSVPQCPPPYDPCSGKGCGDLCTICDPNDPDCVETAVPKFCQPNGGCNQAVPICSVGQNPCTVTLCPTGTTCIAVGDPPEAQCVPNNGGGVCGRVTCAPDQLCCNASCSICVSPGFACTQQSCGHI